MNQLQRLKRRLKKLEVIGATLLFFIPLILWFIEGEVRSSISNYAYVQENHWLPVLLTLTATLFIVNGATNNKHWYNIILGFSLIGVALTPHLDYPTLHYLFAITFFLGSVFTMVFFSSKEQQRYKITASILIIIASVGAFNQFSIFWAEWIMILPICIHFIGESTGKID